MNNIFKGKCAKKLYIKIVSICLAVILLITGICFSTFKKDSNADSLDDAIKKHKSVSRDTSMDIDSSGMLKITKPDTSKNQIKMGKENKWTLFLYVADTSYDAGQCYKLLDNFKNNYVGEDISKNLDIIVQCCPTDTSATDIFTANKQFRAKLTTNGYEIIETAEKSNMSDGNTLYEFLDWGVENYAAEHMLVNIISTSSNGLNSNYGLARNDELNDGLHIYEIEEALAKQRKNMTCRFDGIMFNQYDSALVEYANILSPYAEKMIALSEADGTTIWDYSVIEKIINDNPDVSIDELSKVICDTYDFQCTLSDDRKNYFSDYTMFIDTSYMSYESSGYGISVFDLDKVNDFVVSFNQIMHNIYSQISKNDDLDTLKEFSDLVSISDAYDLISKDCDINIILNALTKLTKIKVDTLNASQLAKDMIFYSRSGEDTKASNKIQANMCFPFYSIEYSYYPADEINFYRNLVLSPYILNTIDYLYTTHWNLDSKNNYNWATSDYYFEDDFGFLPSCVSINEHQGDVSDDMYTSTSLNEATFLELFDQKYTEYKKFTDTWKSYINALDEKRWISLSKSEHKKNNKYYANAFLKFKDIQKYWDAYNAAYLDTDSGYIMLGEQTGVTIDEQTGIMHSEFNYEWVMLSDGQFVRTNVEKNPNQTIYNIPVYMDDENVSIRIEEKQENNTKSLTVLGVYDTQANEKICNLEKGMIISPIYDIFDKKNNEELEDPSEQKKVKWDVEYGDEYEVKGSNDFIYGLLPEDKVTCSFALMKYNGNIYYDVSNIEPLEKKLLVNYTENYSIDDNYNFEVLNNLLRGKEVGDFVDVDKANNQINVISETLEKAQLPSDMTLYRGCSKKTLGEYKDLPAEELIGKTISEPGFLSTSIDKEVTQNFIKDLFITVNAKKGAHAIALKDISNYVNENEILFNKNTQMTITDAEEKEDILYITVTVE